MSWIQDESPTEPTPEDAVGSLVLVIGTAICVLTTVAVLLYLFA